MIKKIALIGSTGSIGKQVLNVVRRNPDKFKIIALAANSSLDLLNEQVKEFQPLYTGVFSLEKRAEAEKLFINTTNFFGNDALTETASVKDADMVVVSVVGMLGLKSVMAAIKAGKDIALANKEALVAGGSLVMEAAKKAGVQILPIDSEHSAVFQALKSGKTEEVDKIILTASGGPFLSRKRSELENVTVEQAIKHPNWNMGKKISVDSATMMNKALELIEARYLFNTEKLEYIIHPESIIHSMVRFIDGSTIAQMSRPTMEIPIQVAIGYPDRLPLNEFNFNFDKPLTFIKPDEVNFPLPSYAMVALKMGGNAPCILNAANEAAVDLFLNRKIKFTDIFEIVEHSLESEFFIKNPTIKDIFDTHEEVYNQTISNRSFKC